MKKTKKSLVSAVTALTTVAAVVTPVTTALADTTNGWALNGKTWNYYLNGNMQRNKWIKTPLKKWYYLDNNGAMVLNTWKKDGTKWYYLGNNGAMITKQWIKVGSSQYYLGTDGVMFANTVTPDGYRVLMDGAWDGKAKVADLTEYKAVLSENLIKDDYTETSWNNYQSILEANKMTENNTQMQVEVAVNAIKNAQKALVMKLRVVSAKALNLKEIEIKFNKPVDTTTAQTLGNYTITNLSINSQAVEINGGKVTLSEDGKTAKIYLGKIAGQQQTFDLTIQNVKDKDGKIIDKTTKSIKAIDTDLPSVVDVEAIGNKTIEVTFSEPVKEYPTIKVKSQGATYSEIPVLNSNNTKATITIPAKLPYGTSLVEISGGKDYAGFGIEKVIKNFVVVSVESAPTAKILEVKDKQVTIKFNRPIKSGTFIGNVNAYVRHTYNASAYQTLGNEGVMNPSGDNQTFVVDFKNPLPPKTTTIYVGTVNPLATAIEDNYGNKFVNDYYSVDVIADIIKPEVSTVEFVDAQTIKVIFSEKVDATTGYNGAKNPANYDLRNKDNKTITITSISDVLYSEDDQSFQLNTTSNAILGGKYTLQIERVQDLAVAKNTINTTTKTFLATDKVLPTVNSKADIIGAKRIRIRFSEPMNIDSITNPNNYDVDSKVKFTASADAKSVVLDYANVTPVVNFFTETGYTIITVGRVKDAEGNATAAIETTTIATNGQD
ncbi:hypothetical protein SH2C18_22070 [Clostridium sediminicola]|uniref:Ig-like domain-containing protein n=1 Tax=Clostridium sediminicola TaxID=3114879 RepID=UPI0031F207D1